MMKFSILSSGSKQNCFYIEAEERALIIDIGISFQKLGMFLERIGGDLKKVSALFITHEHLDHIRGIRSFIKFCDIPVYIHEKSRLELGLKERNCIHLIDNKPVKLGQMNVLPFCVNHDAANTFGFCVNFKKKQLFLASDIGSFNEKILQICRNSTAIAIESNYDQEMLNQSFYPDHIKKRIFGKNGHLSNIGAMEFLKRAISPATKNIFLLHLSENNNKIEIVDEMIKNRLQPEFPDIRFHISRRDEPMEMVEI